MRAQRFVDLTERMIYLRSIPVASMLPPPVLKIIASSLKERIFSPGELLMREGEPISGLHLLTEGVVELTRRGAPPERVEPPESLGFLGVLAKSEAKYHAVAKTSVHTLELSLELTFELLEDHYELLHATLQWLSDSLLQEIQILPAEVLESRLDGVPANVPEDRPLDLVEKVVWLRTLSAFQKTNLNGLAAMANHMQEVRFRDGDRLWSAGENAEYSYFFLKGRAKCETPDGRVWRAGPTSVNGGLEAMAHKQRWYNITAEGPLVVFLSPITSFIDLLEDDFALTQAFLARIASDVIGLLERKAAGGKRIR